MPCGPDSDTDRDAVHGRFDQRPVSRQPGNLVCHGQRLLEDTVPGLFPQGLLGDLYQCHLPDSSAPTGQPVHRWVVRPPGCGSRPRAARGRAPLTARVIDRFALQHRLPGGETVADRFVASRLDLSAANREMLLGYNTWRGILSRCENSWGDSYANTRALFN